MMAYIPVTQYMPYFYILDKNNRLNSSNNAVHHWLVHFAIFSKYRDTYRIATQVSRYVSWGYRIVTTLPNGHWVSMSWTLVATLFKGFLIMFKLQIYVTSRCWIVFFNCCSDRATDEMTAYASQC